MVRGRPGDDSKANDNLVNYLGGDQLQAAITQARLVICRSGFSSIMDLISLQKKAFLIPTPGQTEQEYLARKFEKQGLAYFQMQKELDLKEGIGKALHYKGFNPLPSGSGLLEKAINEIIEWAFG